ncbi:MAG: hypothetical protein K5865_06465 [Eubacterium sp.]|nr:hypothetical protein [Eubacterium sp.]
MLGLIIRLITFPFRYAFGSVTTTYINGFDVVKDRRWSLRTRMMNLIPILMLTTVLITFIYSFVSFIISGGYQTQIGMIKELGICDQCFTSGTVPIMFNVVTISIIGVLLLAEIILCSIDFFKNGDIGTIGRVVCIIVLSLFALAGIILIGDFIYYIIKNGTKEFLDDLFLQSIADRNGISGHVADLITLVMGKDFFMSAEIVNEAAKVVAIVSMIILYFLMKADELDYEVYITKRCILTYCFIIPVIIACFENIIAIVVFILSLLLMCMVLVFFVGGFGGCLDSMSTSIQADTLRSHAKSLDKQASQAFFRSTREEKHKEAAELRHQAYVLEHR